MDDLFIKVLMWLEKHDESIMKIFILAFSIMASLMGIATLIAIPMWLKECFIF